MNAPTPSLDDFAAKINSEFAAIQKADYDTNKNVVQRAIALGRTLCQAKDKVGHGKWEKWREDNCGDISKRTAQRYMKLADSPEVRAKLGKNDTVSYLTLRQALALANKSEGGGPSASDQYDRVESTLVKKLEALDPNTAEACVNNSIERLTAAVAKIKSKSVKAA